MVDRVTNRSTDLVICSCEKKHVYKHFNPFVFEETVVNWDAMFYARD